MCTCVFECLRSSEPPDVVPGIKLVLWKSTQYTEPSLQPLPGLLSFLFVCLFFNYGFWGSYQTLAGMHFTTLLNTNMLSHKVV